MWASIIGELRSHYARSRLGLFWSILHPLAQATIFALVLGEVLGARIGGVDSKVAFLIYLMAGMAPGGYSARLSIAAFQSFLSMPGR